MTVTTYSSARNASLDGPVKVTQLSNKVIGRLKVKAKASNTSFSDITYVCQIMESEGLRIKELTIDAGGNDGSKPKWKERVGNGLVIYSPRVTIDHLIVKNAHNGLWVSGAGCVIKRLSAENCSGDFFQITANDTHIRSANLVGSLAVWPHDPAHQGDAFVHRDIGQWWSRDASRLTGLRITNVVYQQGTHQWASPPQGLMGTEATGSADVIVRNCFLHDVHTEHGVRIENGFQCQIENVHSNGTVTFSMRKGRAGSMNKISNCLAPLANEDGSVNLPMATALVTAAAPVAAMPTAVSPAAAVAPRVAPSAVPEMAEAAAGADIHYIKDMNAEDWKQVDAIDGYIDKQLYGADMAAVKAVAEVESGNDGFLQDGRPKILFEGHIFWRQLEARGIDPSLMTADNHSILHRIATRANYRGGIGEYARLEQACALCEELGLNYDAALCSISMGRYQIMGFNFERCGFSDVTEMWGAMQSNELEHAKIFVAFMKNSNLFKYLQAARLDFDAFARRYNGPSYRRNRYAEKMRAAYEKHASAVPLADAA